MHGWIKSHRKLLDNPIVCKDSDHLAVWMYILLNATHKEYQAMFSGEKILLQPGQLITGRKSISEKFNISESKVQRILKTFESEHQIEQQSSNKNRLVTVLSWSDYQDSEQQNEIPVNNKRTTTEQQLNTNKNVKNVENVDKGNKKDIPHRDLFEKFYETYPRREGRVDAESAWANMLTRKGNPNDVITAAYNYMVRTSADGTDKKFMKQPATFINKDRWKEFLNPSISESRTSIPNYSAKDREAELLHKAIQNSKSGQVSMIDFGPRTD